MILSRVTLLAVLACLWIQSPCFAQFDLHYIAETSTSGIQVAHINHDSIPDLLRVTDESFSIAYGSYDSIGHIHFKTIPNSAFVSSYIFTNARAADWDNDGDIDIIPEVHYAFEYRSLLTENKLGVFSDTAVSFTQPFPTLQHVYFHDFNKDGYQDGFSSNAGVTTIVDGFSGTKHVLPILPSERTYNCEIFDINHDGWLDLLQKVVSGQTTDVHIFLGQADFNFTAGVFVGNFLGTIRPGVGDFDGDGIEDILVFQPIGNKDYSVWTKLLSGTPEVLPISTSGYPFVFTLDINDDGFGDLVIAADSSFTLKLNDANGAFIDYSYDMALPKIADCSIYPRSIGPQKDFIGFLKAIPFRFNFDFSNGIFSVQKSFDVLENAFLSHDNYTKTCMADLEGTGQKELIVGLWNMRGIAKIDISDPNGCESSILFGEDIGESITAIAAADFDADGKDELVFFDRAGALSIGGINAVGNFVLLDTLAVNLDFRNVFDLKIADFDKNGYPDFVFPNNITGNIVVYLNEDGHNFTPITAFNAHFSSKIKVLDVDEDGFEDLIIQYFANQSSSASILYLRNLSDGTFENTNHTLDGYLGISENDTFLKKYIAVKAGTAIEIHTLSANGFEKKASVEIGQFTADAVLLDYNRDSLPDVLYQKISNKLSFICINKGDGTFTKDSIMVPYTKINALYDYDKDGWGDLFMTYRKDWYFGSMPKLTSSGTFSLDDFPLELSISPSPTRDYINLSLEEMSVRATVSIYNNQGQLCKRLETSTYSNIDVQSLHSGLYFLILEQNGRVFTGRFVKE